jgi:glycosyltransferase involved in cell wall biosynthesis
MRLGLISHSPHLCGGERMLVNLAAGMARRQADCLLLVPGEGPMLTVALPPGCTVRRIDSSVPWYLTQKGTEGEREGLLRESVRAGQEIAGMLARWGAEIVVVNTLTNLAGVFAASLLNLPCVVWIHGILDEALLPTAPTPFKALCDEAVLRSAVRLVCPSRWTAVHFEQSLGLPVAVIPNATEVPESVTPFAGETPVFCCLNTWDRRKGLFTVIDAAKLLQLRGRTFHLDLYGDGTLREELHRYVARQQLDGVVRLRPRTVDVAEVYRGALALVTASEMESFGMTLIEAMAHGRPVLVSDTSGHREIMDGPHGIVCPASDPHAFAYRMAWLMDHPDEARRMGERGWRVARERFGLDRLCERFRGVFQEVLAREYVLPASESRNRYAACRPLLGMVL